MRSAPRYLLVAASAALPTCAAEGGPDSPGAAAAPAPAAATACTLSVRFGSYAMGIDAAVAAEVERIVAGDRAVTGTSRSPSGREGEYELCVAVSAEGAARLFDRLKAALPAEPRGPISIRFGEQRFSAPRR